MVNAIEYNKIDKHFKPRRVRRYNIRNETTQVASHGVRNRWGRYLMSKEKINKYRDVTCFEQNCVENKDVL